MGYSKERRTYLRKFLRHVTGTIELRDSTREVYVVNASKGGLCVAGSNLPVGSVVRVHLEVPMERPRISLYCKVVWSMDEQAEEKASGLVFLNTNRILFKEEYFQYSEFIDSVKPSP